MLFAALIILPGCWDAIDINNRDIPTCIGIDKKSGEYYFYSEIPDITGAKKTSDGEQGSDSGSEISVVYGKGFTFVDARENLDNKLDKTYFLGAIRAIVLTDNFLKDGVEPYFHRLQSLSQSRKAIKVISTVETLDDLFKVDPENNTSVGYALDETIETLSNKGIALTITSSEILEYLYSMNPCFIIPNFDIRGGNLALTGYSVMYDGCYKGFIEFEETNGVLFFLKDNAKIMYIVPFGDNKATVEAKLKKKDIEPMLDGDKISFDVTFEMSSQIKYLDSSLKLSKNDIEEIKKNLQEIILADLVFSVEQAKHEFECEYLGFANAFRIAYPNDYKELEWSEAFLESHISISVSTKLDTGGIIKLEEDD